MQESQHTRLKPPTPTKKAATLMLPLEFLPAQWRSVANLPFFKIPARLAPTMQVQGGVENL